MKKKVCVHLIPLVVFILSQIRKVSFYLKQFKEE